MSKRKVPILDFNESTRHIWSLKHLKRSEQKQYIIDNLSTDEAVRLYKETRDEKYVAHIFFSNFGYFARALTRTLLRFGEVFRYTEASDYLSEAYIAVKEALDRFDYAKSNKVLSYLSGAIFFHIRKLIRQHEVANWKNLDGLEEEADDFRTEFQVVSHIAYKDYSKAQYNQDELHYKLLLEDIYERFKDELSEVGIKSFEDMHLLYGELKSLDGRQRSKLFRLRSKIKDYARRRFRGL